MTAASVIDDLREADAALRMAPCFCYAGSGPGFICTRCKGIQHMRTAMRVLGVEPAPDHAAESDEASHVLAKEIREHMEAAEDHVVYACTVRNALSDAGLVLVRAKTEAP